MRIALAQLNPTSGDIEGNTRADPRPRSSRPRDRAPIWSLTPEMALPGYCIGDLVEDAGFLAANERAHAAHRQPPRAGSPRSSASSISIPRRATKAAASASTTPPPWCATATSCSARTRRCSRTTATSTTSASSRRPKCASRWTIPTCAADGAAAGVSICEDLWDEYYHIKPLAELAAKGADVLLNINASPFCPGKRHERDALIRDHIARLRKPLVYVNTAGAADNGKNIIPFDGESLVYDAQGRLLAIGRAVRRGAARRRCRPATGPTPARPHWRCRPSIATARCTTRCVMALRDYMRKTGFTRATVAVSGGIDSALALAIAVDALGAGQRHRLQHAVARSTPRATRSIAERLAQPLGVAYGIIPIQELDEHVRAVFEEHAHPIAQGFTRENLHARIRGLLMMAESNDTGALLISCGNETEIALGYATLYGDMCGGISLIGDLSKLDVYRLARYVNAGTARDDPGGDVRHQAFGRARREPVRPVRLLRRRAGRRRAGRAPHEPRRSWSRLFEQRDARSRAVRRRPRGHDTVYDKHTAADLPRASSTTRSDGCGARSTSGCRARRSSSSRERAFGFDLRETIINGWEG